MGRTLGSQLIVTIAVWPAASVGHAGDEGHGWVPSKKIPTGGVFPAPTLTTGSPASYNPLPFVSKTIVFDESKTPLKLLSMNDRLGMFSFVPRAGAVPSITCSAEGAAPTITASPESKTLLPFVS